MTRRQKQWLGLTGGGLLLAALTVGGWLWLAPGEPFTGLVQAQEATAPPFVRLDTLFNDGRARGLNAPDGLQIQYEAHRTANAGGFPSELTFSIINRSTSVANAAFFLTQAPLPLDAAKGHKLTAEIELQGSDPRTLVGIGYHLLGSAGNYQGEFMPEHALAAQNLPGFQRLAAALRPASVNGHVAQVLPRVSLMNLEPGATVRGTVRWAPSGGADDAEPQQAAARATAQAIAASVAPQQMLIGASFHRYPGISERRFGPIQMDYQFARSLAADGMSGMEWWQGEDRYDWSQVDAWAAYHARSGRGLLVVFSGSPRWASAAPNQPSAMDLPGYAAPPAKPYWPAYGRMVRETVKRLKGRLVGVECWNEPDLIGGFTGTPTELADLCKMVAENTKAVDTQVPVICPQPESPRGLGLVLGARTTQGEPIHQYCDYVGSHLYGHLPNDAQGRPYSTNAISDAVQRMRDASQRFGVNKPLAITEYGISGCGTTGSPAHPVTFGQMPSAEAGEAMYQAIRQFKSMNVGLLALYSYDHGDNHPQCRPGGSFIRTMKLGPDGAQQPDEAVIQRINQAVKEFGRP